MIAKLSCVVVSCLLLCSRSEAQTQCENLKSSLVPFQVVLKSDNSSDLQIAQIHRESSGKSLALRAVARDEQERRWANGETGIMPGPVTKMINIGQFAVVTMLGNGEVMKYQYAGLDPSNFSSESKNVKYRVTADGTRGGKLEMDSTYDFIERSVVTVGACQYPVVKYRTTFRRTIYTCVLSGSYEAAFSPDLRVILAGEDEKTPGNTSVTTAIRIDTEFEQLR